MRLNDMRTGDEGSKPITSLLEAEYSAINTDAKEVRDFLFTCGCLERYLQARRSVRDGKYAGSYIERVRDMVILVMFTTRDEDTLLAGIFKDHRILEVKNAEIFGLAQEFFRKAGFTGEAVVDSYEIPFDDEGTHQDN